MRAHPEQHGASRLATLQRTLPAFARERRRLIRVAALNNSEWCDAFCRAHGIVGHFRADNWFSPVRTPRYYPDAVTLLPGIPLEQVLSSIDTSEGCSVKDSFASLDLAAAGFRPLFRAHWLAREPR